MDLFTTAGPRATTGTALFRDACVQPAIAEQGTRALPCLHEPERAKSTDVDFERAARPTPSSSGNMLSPHGSLRSVASAPAILSHISEAGVSLPTVPGPWRHRLDQAWELNADARALFRTQGVLPGDAVLFVEQ